MKIQKEDLAKWETDYSDLVLDATTFDKIIRGAEEKLQIHFPDEYKDYIRLVGNQACGPIDELDHFLVRYNERTRKALMVILFPMEQVISSTNLLKESIYDNRSLLPVGLIAIGSDYDDDGDAYIIYDVRANSPTYRHVFHWRYYIDNLIVGEGLGLLGRSLKEFLHTPAVEEEL
ncbi:SMI1/KNR4 family protein [Lonsdalea populi]|uniref:SMI1/KNR4 family protein n=1 Tax=Lonsdalea populi TaxID=1172565 RepID=UPI000A1ECE05|nr:SMI1/KNR4 family protein [Lonsdalea populi]OSN02458.1 cell wall assembly protein [Lonsdalea populi]QPQ23072.1 SMI1/KNR4 family protein [Lonsdalea populi]RAT40376.1 cell wall assembly protein [Lonsdalea populi]RAT42886.1 cell wall assembly protein [Lonsdalea populi]RAT59234.1 cell wall assembly protein [Lonsdalea populi]